MPSSRCCPEFSSLMISRLINLVKVSNLGGKIFAKLIQH
jgi:hypothetical protein